MIFNLPEYRVLAAAYSALGVRRITVESTGVPGCPACGVVSERVKDTRLQRIRDIPVAGVALVLWRKRRWFCDEPACPRGSFTEATDEVPRRARSTRRLMRALAEAVVLSGRAAVEAARAHAVSWWLVQSALDAAAATLPDVDALAPKRLGIDEHRYRSVRWYREAEGSPWVRVEPWMTTVVDLDTGQVLGIVDGRDSTGVGEWLFARPLAWRLGVEVVAIDPSAAFRKALRMWLPRTAVSVDAFHLVSLANQAVTEARQRLSQEIRGRRGRTTDPGWANRRLLLRAAETLSERGRKRLRDVFGTDDPTGQLQAAWEAKEQLRTLLASGSLEEAWDHRRILEGLVEAAPTVETKRLLRTVKRWWSEIEVLITTGATTAKVEANNTAVKNIKRTGRGFRNPDNYRSRILLRSAAQTAA
ncbi:ISL3 family transposase [Sinomonas cellulolyticus]|uniref:ISL3 family transposase n=1 Tax=Sinomonas cellulolyticus TaxID=2801916 RepID=UPI001995BEBE|nr:MULTISPECIES: ISL3 family transposase [Sinomonas]GHG59713.1 ISL3 family transposase [Sinomonas sp. KCTC 49339]